MRKYNHRLLELLNRDHLPKFLNLNYPFGSMIEIGTYHGDFAQHILAHWKGKLFCVDPWIDQPDEDYRDGCANGGVAGGRNRMAPIFQSAMDKIRPYGNRATIYRGFSHEAMPRFHHGSMDVVYVDGNHRFENATQDLEGWWGKLNSGGLMGIHDCYIREDEVQRCGVWDAVWNFAFKIDQQPFLTNCTSAWWIKS
jgi:hypothetical protein